MKRGLTSKYAELVKARVFSTNYRLAPQRESAGGGLVLAILLFLRDAGLPLPGGAILLSPWVDLTLIPRFQLCYTNEALAIPYISPMLAESLRNLPPILCQIGGFERLRDETIVTGKFITCATKRPNPNGEHSILCSNDTIAIL
ncbi:calmodulin-dependent protein kinase [Gigaspora margarita]|uniref:Calmodulin-dependent protein kinase n=1 Tax=Gigaspora margarita TaxID=4874 RepID=A0A8H4AXA3_GIGMA|nr:calmodulin-dependent protein kinase [Gigaspora margarita]